MKRIWLLAILISTPFIGVHSEISSEPSQEHSEISNSDQSKLTSLIAQLSVEEKVALLDHLVSEHSTFTSRGGMLPASLRPTAKPQQEKSSDRSVSMEPARRKFTTWTIAPNATSACFCLMCSHIILKVRLFLFSQEHLVDWYGYSAH